MVTASPHVVVAFREESLRIGVAQMLSGAGLECTTASTVEGVHSAIARVPADALIQDISLCEEVVSGSPNDLRHSFPKLAIVLVSGSSDITQALRALRAGADELLLKPFRQEELTTALHSAMKKRAEAVELSRLRTLSPLIEVSKRLGAAKSVDELAHEVLELAMEETSAISGSLMMLDELNQNLYIEASRGIPGDIADAVRQPMGEGVSGWVAQHLTPVRIARGESVGNAAVERMVRDTDRSSISVPLVIAPQGAAPVTLGVLNLNKGQEQMAFTRSDVDLLSILCAQVSLALHGMQLYSNLQGAYMGLISSLASAVDAKDPYTAGHSARVAKYASRLGTAVGMGEQGAHLYQAGILHDIGKIGVADSILKKPGRLDEAEFREMRSHADTSYRILESVDLPEGVKHWVRHHHEWYNGAGYPSGLANHDIPRGARVLAVADAFEAMTSNRPYRRSMGTQAAIDQLTGGSGTQFDPELVDAFVRLPDISAKLEREEIAS